MRVLPAKWVVRKGDEIIAAIGPYKTGAQILRQHISICAFSRPPLKVKQMRVLSFGTADCQVLLLLRVPATGKQCCKGTVEVNNRRYKFKI